MTHLIGLGILLAVFLVIWIIRMIRDGYYSSPFGENPTELARVFSIVLAFVVAIVAPLLFVIFVETFWTDPRNSDICDLCCANCREY